MSKTKENILMFRLVSLINEWPDHQYEKIQRGQQDGSDVPIYNYDHVLLDSQKLILHSELGGMMRFEGGKS